MKLKKFALVAEIVSAIAVVVSLLYVAIEVGQNTRSQDAATYQEIYRDFRANLSAIPRDVRVKVRVENAELTDEEYRAYLGYLTISMRGFENWWQQHELGTISDDVFEAYISHMPILLGDPLARSMWENRPWQTIPGFAEFVDDYLAREPVYSEDMVEIPRQ